MLNKLLFSGHVSSEPKIKESEKFQVVSFSVVHNESYKVGDKWEQKSTFLDCVGFNNQCEYIAKKISKGDLVFVEGKLIKNKYKVGEMTREIAQCKVDKIIVLKKKNDEYADNSKSIDNNESNDNNEDEADDLPF